MTDRFVEIYERREWGPWSRSGHGSDPERTGAYRWLLSEVIARSGYRPLDLRVDPFALDAECLGTIRTKHGPCLFIKEVLLWTNPETV